MNKIAQALLQIATIWAASEGKLKQFVAKLNGEHRPYTEKNNRRLTFLEGMLPFYVSEHHDLVTSIAKNNGWLATMEHSMTRGKSALNWIIISICLPLILVFTAAAIITYSIYIQTNSMDGSVEAAIGLAISIWAISPGLKYFIGDTMEPWKRPIEMVMLLVMLGAFGVAAWEITQHFMIYEAKGNGDMTMPNPFDPQSSSASAGLETVSFSTLYFALSLLEVTAIYALVSALANNLGPQLTPEEKAVHKANAKLRRKAKPLARIIASIQSEMAVLQARKKNHESIESLLQNIMDKFTQ